MSTKDVVASIKQGDRVVYAIGDMEYNAVALGTAHVGYNPAQRLHSAFLSLVYLNEQGTPIKVFGAPILGSEVDDEHLIDSASDARKRDPRNAGASWDDQVALSDEHFERLKANPRTIGWRTGSADDDKRPAAKEEQPAPVESVLNAQELPFEVSPTPTPDNGWRQNLEKSAASGNGFAQAALDANPISPATTPATSAAETSSLTPAEVTEAPVTPAAVPSAEDLDAVAKEQEVAAQTSGETFVQTTPEIVNAAAADSNVEIPVETVPEPAAQDVAEAAEQSHAEVEAANAPTE